MPPKAKPGRDKNHPENAAEQPKKSVMTEKMKKVKKGLAFFSALSYNSTVVADVAQQVERILGKDEVTGSNPVISSRDPSEMKDFLLFRSHFCKFWSTDLHFPVSKHLLVSF